MIRLRPAHERGQADHGWLQTRYTFSFADYHDPDQMGFRSLRVINDDIIAAGGGFGTHGHRDMEIITYVLDGALAHKDGMGSVSVLHPGDVQCMSAGSGITHSEFNHSATTELRLLQIWILPQERGLEPSYAETNFPTVAKEGVWCLIASPGGEAGSLHIEQDMRLSATLLGPQAKLSYELDPDRHAWLQVARGELTLNGRRLADGDGVAVSGEDRLELVGAVETEVLLFDLA